MLYLELQRATTNLLGAITGFVRGLVAVEDVAVEQADFDGFQPARSKAVSKLLPRTRLVKRARLAHRGLDKLVYC